MARGVSSSCDGDIVESGGGGSNSIGFRNRRVRRYFYYETLSQSSSSSDGYDNDDDKVDIFFGTNDIEELNDVIYKEDVIEAYRRECAMKSFRRKQKGGWSSIFQCFEFLKAVFCIPRRDG
ncbi:hypothetical protein Dsin_014997 [Dipteronia sinensis]|uniref:Uncharacterized protein n=1 Tax=Dipteronia sinensis TaxID=43782 RepID=A0AAE0AN89_9ROSI|nr:hypothetical protein Dsin_014997 [Dipteronia sinensis]